jgi:hypothetical protein
MTNSLYLAFKQEQIGDAAGPGHGAVDWEADTVNLVLIDSADYTASINVDADLVDIPSGARVATGTLASKTAIASGNKLVQDAADLTLTGVSGDQSEAIALYKNSGSAATSLLIVLFDTFTSGMPVLPNGGDIVVQWNASGIFDW